MEPNRTPSRAVTAPPRTAIVDLGSKVAARASVLALSTLLLVTTGSAAAATSYTGSFLENSQGASAVGVGPTGWVAGVISNPLAGVWNEAGQLVAEIHGGASEVYPTAYAVNGSGQVLVDIAQLTSHSWLWSNGTLTEVVVRFPANFDYAASTSFAINDRGQIAGTFTATPPQFNPYVPGLRHAFLWNAGQAMDLGTLPGGKESVAIALNNAGQAVGYGDNASGARHAVLWRDGVALDLGTLPGDTSSVALSINDAGDVVGISTAGSVSRPFRWSDGVMTELGGSFDNTQFIVSPDRAARVMNNAGQIVATQTIGGVRHAVVWDRGVITDLNPVLGRDACTANGINDAGQIVGGCSGLSGGNAFRVVPTTPGVDVGVTLSAAPTPATVGQPLTYTLKVANVGTQTATNVTLTDVLPTNATYVSVGSSQGSCSVASAVVCTLGDLAAGASASVGIVVVPTVARVSIVNRANVTSNEADVNPVNNSVSTTLGALPAVVIADLGVSVYDSPDPVRRRSDLTYSIVVRNAGPEVANAVTVTDTLPSSMSFVSAFTSQGACSGTATVTCNLGDLANGVSAYINIVVRPRSSGTYRNTVTIRSSTTDNNSANNSATVATRVR
jgi:uncharacterized repeat protein (TIGR01451 family)